MPSSCQGTPSGKEALRSFEGIDMVAKTFAQVRKKTLLNKEDIACSEVIPFFWPIFNPGPQLLVPILRSQLGRQRGRMPLRLVQVSIYEQFDFFKLLFSNSPIKGVDPCSRIEDVTNYQNALSKALLVSLLPPHPLLLSRRVG